MPREDRDYRSSRYEDEDRDVLGRRRGGWYGDSERHAEIGRRSFEAHARAFGLPMEEGRGGGRSRMSEERGYRPRGEEERGYRMREDERGGYRMRGEDMDRGYRMRGEDMDRGYRTREYERGGYRMRGEDMDRGYRMREDERGGYGEDRPRGVGPSWYDEVERQRSQGWRGRDEDEGVGYRSRGGGEDEERDRLGRRRGGWYGDPEGHAEVARRSFEAHARAFGLPEEGRGGGRYRSRRDEEEDRGYRSRGRDEDEDRSYMAREDEDEERDRLGRRKGGWFGDPEGHAEAARRRWDRAEGRE